jgi:hypothetical protein
MDHLIDWLTTPEGIELTHAVIVVLMAIGGYLTWLTRRNVQTNAERLNDHLEQHVIDAAHTTSSVVDTEHTNI